MRTLFLSLVLGTLVPLSLAAQSVTKIDEQYGDMGLYENFRLTGKNESCRFTILHGDTLLTRECLKMRNSKEIAIVCTPKKSICKTEKELFYFEAHGKLPASRSSSGSRGTSLKNMTYTIGKQRYRLHNGKYSGSNPVESLTFGEMLTKGDLNGDGKPEYVVTLYYNGGGSGVFPYIAVVSERGGTLQHVSAFAFEDRTQIKSASIKNGILSVNVIEPGPNDPGCCPSQKRTYRFKL